MDKFVWVDTTSGKSFINLADVSVICFIEDKNACDIHLKSGTIFTTPTLAQGEKFCDDHEDYLLHSATVGVGII